MKLPALAVATLAIAALAGGTAIAQVTMQPIPNPPEKAAPHHHWHSHRHWHAHYHRHWHAHHHNHWHSHRHMKAKSKDATPS